jgi:DNA (cytosine-5)-methyltransferase 1
MLHSATASSVNPSSSVMPANVVDLFCGIGGMTHGFVRERFDVVAGIDIDKTCKYAYETNNDATFLTRDVAAMTSSEIAALFPAGYTRALIGCAPCQPYSLYTNHSQRRQPDRQWELLRAFARIASDVRPEIVSMENVPRLVLHPVFKEFVASLEKAEYAVTWFVARGADYGIPQRRSRLVLFASQLGPVALIPPTHERPVTVRDVIEGLPALAAGEVDAADPLHRARALSEINLRRVKATKPGKAWKDWPEELQLACHKTEKGRSYRSVYGRIEWDQPAPVITTQFVGVGNGRFTHPEQHRALSLREAALLQTFPRSYDLADPACKKISMQQIARQLGNAVPVRLGQVVARSIRRHLELFDD